MQKYLQAKYIFGFIFGILVVYVVNKNIDLLFQSRLVEDAKPISTQSSHVPEQGSIQTH
ncbi:MAG: hypothetical protein OEW60_07310 [Thiovulaceae bacterium]|nr:hypothetical protein [Sulfurimonadaceae bacterium]